MHLASRRESRRISASMSMRSCAGTLNVGLEPAPVRRRSTSPASAVTDKGSNHDEDAMVTATPGPGRAPYVLAYLKEKEARRI